MTFTTLLLMLIKIVLAAYKDAPLIENERAIAIGINSIIVLSCSIKIFFTAGSSNHAIAAVPPATAKDKISAIDAVTIKNDINTLILFLTI